MKKILTVVVLLIGTTTFAQNKNTKASMDVNGVCGVCKSRIEKACLNIKGVKYAQWNLETHELKLIFDGRKTNTELIERSILKAGHDIGDKKAKDEDYAKLDHCCKYRDEEVVKNHK